MIRLFHIFFVGGLFFYIAVARSRMPLWMYPFLLGLGAFIFLYHAYKSFFKKDAMINYFHMLVISPLLIYIGLKRTETPNFVFEFMLLLAIFSVGHHAM
jgi:hypothetical protein